jgi:hypothetical protein
MSALWNQRTALLTGLVVTLLGAFYIYQSPLSLDFTMPHSTLNNGVPGFNMSLSQKSQDPPTLVVTLENNDPDTPYTVLKWGTPMDPYALDTGVFSIVDEVSHHEVEQTTVHVTRKMPPPPNQLLTLAPGMREEFEVVFNKPWMPKHRPAMYKVSAKGIFKGAWAKHGGDVTKTELYAYAEGPFSGRKFATNEVIMKI